MPDTHRRSRTSLSVAGALSAVLVLSAAVVTGCRSGGNTSGTSYVVEYEQGRFTQARSAAEEAAKSGPADQRARASLIAGLSASALKDAVAAKRWLEPLLNDPNPDIAGRAGAQLGLIARDEGNNARAASLLSGAAPKLSGDERARAAMYAGDAFDALDRLAQAREQYTAGVAAAHSPDLKRAIQGRLEPGPYSVQMGVFAVRTNAEHRATEVRTQAAQLGYGAPRVAAGRGADGRAAYSVLVGKFASRRGAIDAKARLGGDGVVTKAQDE